MGPGIYGKELVRSKCDIFLVIGATVRKPSPISSSSTLLFLTVKGLRFNTNFGCDCGWVSNVIDAGPSSWSDESLLDDGESSSKLGTILK